MDPAVAPKNAVVSITREFDASPARLFQAWTDPEMMSEWFARAPGTPPGVVVRNEVVPGGRYVVDVTGPEDGKRYRMQGTYREVEPPHRLSFTWWYDSADFAESFVTIDIRPIGEHRSELTLTHTLLPEPQVRPHHTGWIGCLAQLEAAVARRG